MARKVSAELDNGQMPSKSYMIWMEQQTLPPGTSDLPPRHASTSTTTAAATMTGGGTTVVHELSTAAGMVHHNHDHRGRGWGRMCGACWCSVFTMCCVFSFVVIIIIIMMVFMTQPWKTMMHSFPLLHDDGSVGWSMPYPSILPRH